MDPHATPDSRIGLNLESGAGVPESRRQRPMVDPIIHERPKLEPAIPEGGIGSDESRQTVGFLMLAALLPEALGGWLGHGTGFIGVAIPAAVAWGLITGSDWICEYAFWSCVAQLVLVPMLAFSLPHPALVVPATLLRYGGLVLLLADRALSRKTYVLAVAAVVLGALLGIVGSLLR